MGVSLNSAARLGFETKGLSLISAASRPQFFFSEQLNLLPRNGSNSVVHPAGITRREEKSTQKENRISLVHMKTWQKMEIKQGRRVWSSLACRADTQTTHPSTVWPGNKTCSLGFRNISNLTLEEARPGFMVAAQSYQFSPNALSIFEISLWDHLELDGGNISPLAWHAM